MAVRYERHLGDQGIIIVLTEKGLTVELHGTSSSGLSYLEVEDLKMVEFLRLALNDFKLNELL